MASTRDNTVFGQCRCCLSDGYHRDIMKSYYKNGVREVYYDIFMDCFNLFLSTSSKLGTLVCVSCVKRLREAQEFKTMVVETERKLLSEIGDQDTLCVNVPEAPVLEIKAEPDVDIKFEPDEDCNGTEADHNYEDEQVAVPEVLVLEIKAEPDLDIKFEPNEECNGTEADHTYEDEPVTEPPIDEDLVEGEAELLRRFGPVRPLPTRQALYTISPNFARHLDLLRGKVIRSNMIEKLLEENGNHAKTGQTRSIYLSEKVGQVTNILLMLENSNLTPFKSKNRAGFPCFYCRHSFETLAKMKEHQKSHKKTELKKLLLTYGAECLVVYVDITDLKCTICDLSIPNLSNLKSHLIKTHKKKYRQEFTDRVIPFKLTDNNVYECQICGFTFETFGSVERHMNTHYRNYVCKDCGTGFVTKYRLKVHIKSMHVDGSFPCESCKKVFSSQQKLKNHVDTVHKLVKRFKCTKCPERFSEYFRRQKHMVTVHGVAPLQYKCNVCDKSFDRRYTLSRHMKRDHLEERDFQCELCSYKCFTNNELRVHMIKHNGERIFECAVCKKSYARKKTLKEHTRIHNNDRRFACAVCGQAFVQKCSLKGHIKTHHVDYAV